jgi:DNA repair exonuclease SbcCD nuclease subunit
MAPKIFVIGDLHVKSDNVKTSDLFFEKFLDMAKEQKPDLVVILGDVLDSFEKIHMNSLNRATKFFQDCKKIAFTVVVVGNHERVGNYIFLTDESPFLSFKEWSNFLLVDKVETLFLGNYKLLFVPYVPNGRYFEALETLPECLNNPEPTLVFSHQEFRGVMINGKPSDCSDHWAKHFPMNIVGHIHTGHIPQNNLVYLGTPYPITFAETDQKYIGLVYINPDFKKFDTKDPLIHVCKNVLLKRIPMNIGTKITLKVSPEEAMNIQEKVEELIADGADVRVSIEGSTSEISSVIKRNELKSLSKLAKVVYNDTTLIEEKITEEIPDFEFVSGKFLDFLYKEIEKNTELVLLYKDIFSK